MTRAIGQPQPSSADSDAWSEIQAATVTDVIVNRGRFSAGGPGELPLGAVLIFNWTRDIGWLPLLGDSLLIVRPNGQVREERVRELKELGAAAGIYVVGLTRGDVNVGDELRWWRPTCFRRTVDDLGRIRPAATDAPASGDG